MYPLALDFYPEWYGDEIIFDNNFHDPTTDIDGIPRDTAPYWLTVTGDGYKRFAGKYETTYTLDTPNYVWSTGKAAYILRWKIKGRDFSRCLLDTSKAHVVSNTIMEITGAEADPYVDGAGNVSVYEFIKSALPADIRECIDADEYPYYLGLTDKGCPRYRTGETYATGTCTIYVNYQYRENNSVTMGGTGLNSRFETTFTLRIKQT